jgi:hypothetical protein
MTYEQIIAEINLGEESDFTLQQAHMVINRLRRVGIWTRVEFMAHGPYIRVEMGRPSEQWDVVLAHFPLAVHKAASMALDRLRREL